MCDKSKKSFFIFLLGLFMLATFGAGAALAVPQTINYQGYLTDPDGTPLNVSVDMTFSIYDAAEGGVLLWSESHSGVTVTEGIFNVVLGETSPFSPADFDGDRFLGVQVGADAEMTPRQQFTSVAYALAAEYANSVGDGVVTTASLSDTSVTSGKIADDAVIAAKIAAGAITTDKVGTDAITGDKIADGSITASDIIDGSGSGLDADLLDGLHASAFMAAGTDSWVNTSGDAMSGDLTVSGRIGVGTASPEKTLHVVGDTKLWGTSGNDAKAIELLVGQSSSGKGGQIYIKAGDAPMVHNSEHWGGDVVIKGGMGYNNSGGDLKLEGGTSSVWTLSSTPTKVDIYGGDLDGFYASSGLITVEGGKQLSQGSSNRNGGHIFLMPGTGEGSGVSGNVGVGTTSPASKLEVAGMVHSTSGGFKFPDNSVQTTAVSVDGHSLDASDGDPSDVVYVDDAGNVGIGTASPEKTLHVVGDTKLVGTSGAGATAIDMSVNQSTSGKGGGISIKAGTAQENWSSDHWGGDVLVKGGSGYNNSGGNTKIEGGTTSIWTYSTTPTQVDIYGGDIDNNYTSSGLITVQGGKQLSSNGPNRNGGHIFLMPGTGEGSGVSGNVGIGTTTPTAQLDINGSTGFNQLRVRASYTPTGTSDTNGNTGDITWDEDYVYVKTSAGWKRAALSTW